MGVTVTLTKNRSKPKKQITKSSKPAVRKATQLAARFPENTA
jgi:hypothetical protein